MTQTPYSMLQLWLFLHEPDPLPGPPEWLQDLGLSACPLNPTDLLSARPDFYRDILLASPEPCARAPKAGVQPNTEPSCR